MTASLLTLDVKGAFDAVLPGRLIRRLREQGWPTNLVLWIASFATGRSVQIRLDGEIGASTNITCGLPQGSPVSGILFMLYIAPLFRLGNPRNKFALLATIRLRRLDPYHPLRRRAEQVASNGRQTSRFARRILALPNSEQINPLQYAPWHPRESHENAQARIGAPMGRTKEQAAADFTAFQRTIPSSDIIIFSDGSRLVDRRAGDVYIGFQAHYQFLHSSLLYGHGKEVFDAEAEAALAGAQAVIAYPTAQFATNLWICLDNLEVATRLLSPSTGSSQEVFESFRTLAAAWPLRERLPHTKNGSI
ncbi:reverse transcriptase, putative [Talaromyces stipitatus ATCC 10500]|uniref:Reverse transcriptase, putative n=1 Tax=Talaromyces stipitatus (strain ATCC 10500 / CBS 375.48 / QM 6759 / NRRL 1006) TaxID=441959 RepID=B8MVG1_TALSN|nr:reverse transcriptase, putative [Talaromyces stipitatus ATCC 10500]EED11469.1 reverse transcriptase, putative [Talaromyces stipitatus ATCC 10500]